MRASAKAPAFAAVLAIVSCQLPAGHRAERAAPITYGTPDEGDLGVVGLVGGGVIFCTGTLVSERVVVTAGHCVGTPAPEAVVFGATLAEGEQVAVIDKRAEADFDISDLANDIGAVLLAEPAPALAQIWQLWQEPFDESLIGREIRIVGFGETENPDDGAGVKREGRAQIEAYAQTTFRFTANPSQTCLGDSGGPAFLTEDSVEYLIGVTSAGDPACVEFAEDTRVDAFAAGFLLPYIEATGEGVAGEGARCYYPENCAVGHCLAPVDTPAFSYCASACQDSVDCAEGMECVEEAGLGRVCRFEGPEPGALGASCTDRLDCATDLCAAESAGGSRLCTVRCLPNGGSEGVLTCPDHYECRVNPERADEFACFEEPAGCSCNPASGHRTRGSPWLPALLMIVAIAAFRRRFHRN